MAKLVVKSHFQFAHAGNEKVPAFSKEFEPGVHDVDDAVVGHPWIKSGADGAVDLDQSDIKVDDKTPKATGETKAKQDADEAARKKGEADKLAKDAEKLAADEAAKKK